MALYLGRRLLIGAATLLAVSVIVFIAIHVIPGGYEQVILGPFATPEARGRLAERFGLDAPLIEQYFRWLGAALHGDFGSSLVTSKAVSAEFGRRLPATVQLAVMATAISVVIGAPLALIAGWPRFRKKLRGAGRFAGALQMSVPDFVIGTVLLYVLSRYSLGLTAGGFVPFVDDPVQNLRSMIPPALALSVFGTALVVRTGRDAVMSVAQEPYITAALAAGHRDVEVIRRHVVRNAAIPVITVLAAFVGYLLSGTIIVETLFSVPGVGQYMFQAVGNRDYAIVQAGVLLAALVFVGVNLLADLMYALVDPRVRLRRV